MRKGLLSFCSRRRPVVPAGDTNLTPVFGLYELNFVSEFGRLTNNVWNKPDHLSAAAVARPVRVAYLIDPADCPDALLDAIFAESYSRWGGRRTLIVPACVNGIDATYSAWLSYFDADVVYSFVDLNDSAVAKIHEQYCPAYLVHHDTHRREKNEPGYYNIRLPLEGLPSLSVIPAYLSRSWGWFERISNLVILDKYYDKSESQFLKENFGFVSKSFKTGLVSRTYSDLFSCLTLISKESRDDPRAWKEPAGDYVVEESEILKALGKRRSLTTLAQLSEFFAPRLIFGRDGFSNGVNLVVGDGVDDRLLFWNGHHHYHEVYFNEITGLRVPEESITDTAFLRHVCGIIKQRGRQDTNINAHCVILRSCSVSQARLEEIAKVLREDAGFVVNVRTYGSHEACVPKFRDSSTVRTQYSLLSNRFEVRENTEFDGSRFTVPAVAPWHIREARPPAGLRNGYWMLDLSVDRLADHCRYSNMRHVWLLPRRLRLERAFRITRPDNPPWDIDAQFIRVTGDGTVAVAHRADQKASIINIPEDIDAFRVGLCNEFEWEPFDRSRKDAPHGLSRYRYSEPSDKGRYLLAVLELFDTLPEAFDILMNGFWRDVLLSLGAAPAERNVSLRKELIRTLQKRLSASNGELVFRGDAELQRLAREAIRFGRKIQKERRFVRYGRLKASWQDLVQEDLYNATHLKDSDKEYYRRESHLDRSIQHLCRREILFQGREWQCGTCFNRNWITIDAIGRILTCSVCGREEPPPVSGDWHFRANAFLIEAYREHGVEAVVWTLWELWKRAQRSFYFAPSMWLWNEYPEEEGDGATPDAELDILAVVDGKLYLCEVKSSSALSKDELKQLVGMATKIRPDVLVISCMDEPEGQVNAAVKSLTRQLSDDIRVELLSFDPKEFERSPLLPS